MTRTDTPAQWDERSTLLALLDYTRQTAWAKTADLAPELVGAAPLSRSPLMSLGEVILHLTRRTPGTTGTSTCSVSCSTGRPGVAA